MLRLFLACSGLSLLAMILIDRVINPKAEFLNAWSVVERLIGRAPSAAASMIAQRFGGLGELLAVLLANMVAGFLLALLARATGLFR